jgi:hypothetical protein
MFVFWNLMQNKIIIVSCVPNVASFSFLIALLIFSNGYSLLVITLCWSLVDDMNSLFVFQTKSLIRLSFSTLHISRVINLYYDIDCLIYPSIAWSSVLIKYNSVLIIN